MMAMIFFILFALAAVVCFVFSIYKTVNFIKDPKEQVCFTGYFKQAIPLALGFTVAFTAMLAMIYPWAKISPKSYEGVQAILGGIVFASTLVGAVNLFMVYYYRKNIPDGLKKHLFRIMIGCFFALAISLFVTLNGYADYLTYPLVNAISLKTFFSRPGEEGFIAFYAIFILTGAIIVYLLCDHKMYMEYGKHGILESTFLVAFPSGIIGARLFYVIGNYNVPIGEGGFGGVFDLGAFINFRQGGLTILGGAVVGIVAGVAWFMWRNKQYNIWVCADMIVPTILIAQTVGRWGNFFNCEVHGLQVSEEYWSWLPRIIFNNAHYSSMDFPIVHADAGKIFVPLFLVEGFINLFGFGLLAHVFGKKLKKATEPGDLIFGYVIWYGLTRTLLEPLRDPSFNMGKDGYWSWIWSMVFIAVGAVLILGNHVVRYILKKKQNKLSFSKSYAKSALISSIALGFATLIGLVITIVLFSIGHYTGKIAYNKFNLGLIFMVGTIAGVMATAIAVFNFVTAKRFKPVEQSQEVVEQVNE